MFRSLSQEPYCNVDLNMLNDEIRSLTVRAGSNAEGKSVAEVNQEELSIKLLALHRDLQTIANPNGDMLLQEDDIVVLMGPGEKIDQAANWFSESSESAAGSKMANVSK
jgi:Trk K+ transport system NAD-binding subunit